VRTNLDHLYAGRTDGSWLGFWIFAASMVVVVVGWVAATPLTLRHPRLVQRVGYALIGAAQRLFEHLDARPGQYTEKDISPYLWHNGKYPDSAEYRSLQADDFRDYRLRISGLVDNSVELDLTTLRALPTTSRPPSTSASRAGPASRNGAAYLWRPSSTWSNPIGKPAGW
jgi:hypothetical protein